MDRFGTVGCLVEFFYLNRPFSESTEPEKPKHAALGSLPRSTSNALDLTSSEDCLAPLDTSLLDTFTNPLDFTHLVGPWFLELVRKLPC